MHFNGIRSNNGINNNQNNINKNHDSVEIGSSHLNDINDDQKNLIVIGTIKVDEFSRLTFTKKIKSVFQICPRDIIVVYKNKINNEFLFKVQRFNEIVDTWRIKKEKDMLEPFISNKESKAFELNGNEFKDITKCSKELHQPSLLDLKKDIRILIIDDEKDITEMFKEVILFELDTEKNEKKINIDTFDSSTEALIHFVKANDINKNNSGHYDLIILDIRMPKINGIQLYRILKIINPQVNILIISALEMIPELANSLPEMDPKDILKKPVDIEYFFQKFKEKVV
jgi:CheY-like chemotaxis protein